MTGINGGTQVTTGFGHGTVLSVANDVIDAVNQEQSVISFLSADVMVQSLGATITLSL